VLRKAARQLPPDQPAPPRPPRLFQLGPESRHITLGMFGVGLQVGDAVALAVGLFTL
jgi:hypothetical protein